MFCPFSNLQCLCGFSFVARFWQQTSESRLEKSPVPKLWAIAPHLHVPHKLPLENCSWVLQYGLAENTELPRWRRGLEKLLLALARVLSKAEPSSRALTLAEARFLPHHTDDGCEGNTGSLVRVMKRLAVAQKEAFSRARACPGARRGRRLGLAAGWRSSSHPGRGCSLCPALESSGWRGAGGGTGKGRKAKEGRARTLTSEMPDSSTLRKRDCR